jgi:hypothetical protein
MKNHYNYRDSDPVIEWLNSHQGGIPVLLYEAYFELNQGPLIVRSNSSNIIDSLKTNFHYYQDTPKETLGIPTIAEVFCVDSLMKMSSVGLKPSREAKGEHNVSETFQSGNDEFIHIKIDGTECLWRPFDMLVTFSENANKSIRVLVGNPLDRKMSGAKYKMKGSHIDVEEIVDLIKVLYVRRHGRFCLHAAVLELCNQGVLITGNSGSGKTTTALALVRSGFTLLSDELSLIGVQDGALRAGGMLMPPRLAGNIPADLQSLESTIERQGNGEKNIFILPDPVVRAGIHRLVTPSIIFFLEKPKKYCDAHRINPVGPQDAFVDLMNQILDPTNASRKIAQVEILITLVKSVQTYRLTLGRNLRLLPDLIKNCMTKKRRHVV